jgi:Uma2 family endonuclease
MATASKLMTTEELLAMPDDGVDRWLIEGELRERRMTRRNRYHSSAMAILATELTNWNRSQPEPRGKVYAGEVGGRLSRHPDSTVGIDIAYIDAKHLAKQPKKRTMISGPPALAVEILSPKNDIEDVEEKVRIYRKYGVKLTWVVNPYSQTVTAYRPKGPPAFFHAENELTAEGTLPGFRVAVADLFV